MYVALNVTNLLAIKDKMPMMANSRRNTPPNHIGISCQKTNTNINTRAYKSTYLRLVNIDAQLSGYFANYDKIRHELGMRCITWWHKDILMYTNLENILVESK